MIGLLAFPVQEEHEAEEDPEVDILAPRRIDSSGGRLNTTTRRSDWKELRLIVQHALKA